MGAEDAGAARCQRVRGARILPTRSRGRPPVPHHLRPPPHLLIPPGNPEPQTLSPLQCAQRAREGQGAWRSAPSSYRGVSRRRRPRVPGARRQPGGRVSGPCEQDRSGLRGGAARRGARRAGPVGPVCHFPAGFRGAAVARQDAPPTHPPGQRANVPSAPAPASLAPRGARLVPPYPPPWLPAAPPRPAAATPRAPLAPRAPPGPRAMGF